MSGRGLKKGHPQVAMAIQKSEEDRGIETRDPMQMTQGQGWPRYFLVWNSAQAVTGYICLHEAFVTFGNLSQEVATVKDSKEAPQDASKAGHAICKPPADSSLTSLMRNG